MADSDEQETTSPLDEPLIAPSSQADPDSSLSRYPFHLEMARFNQACHQNRQIYEWKMAFGIWTAVGVFTYFVLEKRSVIPMSPLGLLAIYVALFLIWFWVWYIPMITATERDRHYRNAHLREIEKLFPIPPDPKAAARIISWNWFTPVFTAAILMGSWYVIWQAQQSLAARL